MNRNLESEVALSVGGDLDEAAEAAVERRAAVCPETRACREEMRASLEALHACRDRIDEDADVEDSLWPAMATRLPARAAEGSLEFLRPWVPAITVAALLLSLATVATNPRERRGTLPEIDGSAWNDPVHAGRLTAPALTPPPREVDVFGERMVDPLDPDARSRENGRVPLGFGVPRPKGPTVHRLPNGKVLFFVPPDPNGRS